MRDALDYWLQRPTTEHDDRDGLRDGRWVKGVGGVARFVPDPNVGLGDDERDVCERFARNFDTRPHRPAPRSTICDHCDCLLAYTGETCPGCLAWSELNACATSWKAARIAYKPSRNDVTEVAA